MSNFKHNGENKGKVVYSKEILKSVIGLSVSEVEGVKVNYVNGDKEKLDGIKLTTDGDKISVDVTVDMFYGYNLPEVAYFIQQNIKHKVETMTKYKISTVDVHVDNVLFKEESAK